VAAGEEGDEHFINDMLLADDDFSDFVEEALACGGEEFDKLTFGERCGGVGGSAHEICGVSNSADDAKFSSTEREDEIDDG